MFSCVLFYVFIIHQLIEIEKKVFPLRPLNHLELIPTCTQLLFGGFLRVFAAIESSARPRADAPVLEAAARDFVFTLMPEDVQNIEINN